MKCHIILHADFEPAGAIVPWVKHKKMSVEFYRPYAGDELPEVHTNEPVIVMGGPQNAKDYQQYPYLAKEVDWMKKLLKKNHPFIGVCLGAQLIAESLGAKTEQSPEKEVGTFNLTLTEAGKRHPYLQHLPDTFPVFHWHNDMPGLPNGAEILATSEGCPRQIIEFSPSILGFQCHFEMTPSVAKGLLDHAKGDLTSGRFINDAQQILTSDFTQMNLWLFHILDHWYAQLDERHPM